MQMTPMICSSLSIGTLTVDPSSECLDLDQLVVRFGVEGSKSILSLVATRRRSCLKTSSSISAPARAARSSETTQSPLPANLKRTLPALQLPFSRIFRLQARPSFPLKKSRHCSVTMKLPPRRLSIGSVLPRREPVSPPKSEYSARICLVPLISSVVLRGGSILRLSAKSNPTAVPSRG